jgi:hypothetical protein
VNKTAATAGVLTCNPHVAVVAAVAPLPTLHTMPPHQSTSIATLLSQLAATKPSQVAAKRWDSAQEDLLWLQPFPFPSKYQGKVHAMCVLPL